MFPGRSEGGSEYLAFGLNETVSGAFTIGSRPRGEGSFVGEPVAMHRLAKVPFDGMGFPLILADGLQAVFADVASTRLPERLASLMRSLSADGDERSGEEPNHGATAADTSSRVDRRRRRRA